MEFWILRFSVYPNALKWLDETPGVAITQQHAFREFPVFSKLLISKLVTKCGRETVLTQFPSAYQTKLIIHPGDNIEHYSYTVDGNMSQVVDKLKALGGVVKNSPCYLEPLSTEECQERLQELQVRSGQQDLSRMDMTELDNLYRSLYP